MPQNATVSSIEFFNTFAFEDSSGLLEAKVMVIQNLIDTYFALSKKPLKVLDVGIGTGGYWRNISTSQVNVTGIDGSKERLRICSNNNPGIKTVMKDLDDLSVEWDNDIVPDNYFDLVVCNATLKYLRNALAVIERLIEKTQKNGVINITTCVIMSDENMQLTDASFDDLSCPVYATSHTKMINVFNQHSLAISDHKQKQMNQGYNPHPTPAYQALYTLIKT